MKRISTLVLSFALLGFGSIGFAEEQLEENPNAQISFLGDVDVPEDSNAESSEKAFFSSCSISISCPIEGVVTCTATGVRTQCTKGFDWVRCRGVRAGQVAEASYVCRRR